jgi:hypothetical protein
MSVSNGVLTTPLAPTEPPSPSPLKRKRSESASKDTSVKLANSLRETSFLESSQNLQDIYELLKKYVELLVISVCELLYNPS